MRIAVFTTEDHVFLLDAWRRLLPDLAREHEIVGIRTFPDVLKNLRGAAIPLWYLRTFGPMTVARLAWRSVRAGLAARGGYGALARTLGVPLLHGKDPNDPDVVSWVERERVDVVLITLGYVLKAPLLKAVRVAVLNKHSALLPAYRGLLPVFWTLLDGTVPVGVTVHRVDEKIDHGEHLVQRAYPGFRGSVFDAYVAIYRDMPELFAEAIAALVSGRRTLVPPSGVSCYKSLPTRPDVRAFRAKGLRFV